MSLIGKVAIVTGGSRGMAVPYAWPLPGRGPT